MTLDDCRRLSSTFYARVAHDPVLLPLFPSKSFHCAVENLALYLNQALGGPCLYSEERWSLSLREAHQRFRIGPRERDAWMRNMLLALEDAGIPEHSRPPLIEFFEQSSQYIAGAASPEPSGALWTVQYTIEEIVRQVRAGNAGAAFLLLEDAVAKKYFERDRAGFLSLLAILGGSGHPEFTNYVTQQLDRRPQLVEDRYTYGRTLLHAASQDGASAIAEELLQRGADPNALDRYGHAPLYFAATPEMVHVLARHGADLDAQDTVKRCTALHMAARFGRLEVASALLDCGARLDVPDRSGETPLRRAVNLNKLEIARLLVSRGANIEAPGSKGLTPLQAAKSIEMKRILANTHRTKEESA